MRITRARVRGMFGVGVVLHWDMRVLSLQLGPWSIEIEGPQS
jgi:hypothetical protein